MSQNREPPAYLEYPGTILPSMNFRLATGFARGLWWTLRMECWANYKVPSNLATLAAYLSLPEPEVVAAMPGIKQGFVDDGEWITCPELDDYREHLRERKCRQIEGGKKGAAIAAKSKNLRRGRTTKGLEANPRSAVNGHQMGYTSGLPSGCLIQHSTPQQDTTKYSNQGVDLSTPAWLPKDEIGDEF